MRRIDGLDAEIRNLSTWNPSVVAQTNQADILHCLGQIASISIDRINAQGELDLLKQGKSRPILHGTNKVALISLLERDHRGSLEYMNDWIHSSPKPSAIRSISLPTTHTIIRSSEPSISRWHL